VFFTLRSADMIHSFWVPVLAGKMDLIPGRTNRLSVVAEKPGTYRGQCAEFCGTSHAFMAFPVVVMTGDDFRTWVSARAAPSQGLEAIGTGARLFREQRCGECHRVAGSDAAGTSGPDLSHVGSRLTIGAGLLDNSEESIARFISHAPLLKPVSRMPAYAGLTSEELTELARWLKALQ
jgi:cytochrome c oxidase subunit 2